MIPFIKDFREWTWALLIVCFLFFLNICFLFLLWLSLSFIFLLELPYFLCSTFFSWINILTWRLSSFKYKPISLHFENLLSPHMKCVFYETVFLFLLSSKLYFFILFVFLSWCLSVSEVFLNLQTQIFKLFLQFFFLFWL